MVVGPGDRRRSPAAALVRRIESGPTWDAAFYVPVPSLLGAVLRPGETDLPDLWAAPADPWPMGPPAMIAVEDGFLVAWSAWGGDIGMRLVAAPWGLDGIPGAPRDVWRGSPVGTEVALLPGRDGPFAIWIDDTTRELRGRVLDVTGAPVATAVGLGAFPGCTSTPRSAEHRRTAKLVAPTSPIRTEGVRTPDLLPGGRR